MNSEGMVSGEMACGVTEIKGVIWEDIVRI